ncbi:aminotransferase class III-fold pyridoxal phosphate-dependent enzyme [Streptomyces longwoodensis]|uniref:aspartate aminotransferase family protein n=1 Tax=Streptomyces longwoodensis TaxID=68231 RepID=UPI0033D7093A
MTLHAPRTATRSAPPPPLPLTESVRLAAAAAASDAIVATADDVIPSDRLIDGEYPLYAARGEGAYVWDVDGNRYLDFILAYGTIILGHAHRAVDDAAVSEIRQGFALSMLRPAQQRLTRRLTEVIPHAETALLVKTGSDATSSAVRLSRAFTGRDVVVRWGYNGWHDWAAIRSPGVPRTVAEQVTTFGYNDLSSLEEVLHRFSGRVACILMMPFETTLPKTGFLQGVRELADRHGALLVLDEIRSGFRLGLGGAQEAFGVRADLVTVGKAMANGYAVSAVAGRADILRELANVHISSTFFANSLDMAASLATIDVLATTPALARVEALGIRLQQGLRDVIARTGLPARVVGAPQMPFLQFDDAALAQRRKRLFYTWTVREGLLLHPNHHWYVSAALSDADVDHTLAVADRAARHAVATGEEPA